MNRYFGDEEKPSLDYLSHHGVKGMKWGVERKGPSEGGISGGSKKSAILGARNRHNTRMVMLDSKAADLSRAKGAAQKQKILKDIHSLADEGIKSGDSRVAHKMTLGQKALSVALGNVVGLGGVAAYRKVGNSNDEKKLAAYKNSKVEDYHDAS